MPAEPDHRHETPADAWIKIAAALLHTALDRDGLLARTDAHRWLDALEQTALDATNGQAP